MIVHFQLNSGCFYKLTGNEQSLPVTYITNAAIAVTRNTARRRPLKKIHMDSRNNSESRYQLADNSGPGWLKWLLDLLTSGGKHFNKRLLYIRRSLHTKHNSNGEGTKA